MHICKGIIYYMQKRFEARFLLILSLTIFIFHWQMSGCHDGDKISPGETAVRNYFYFQTDSLLLQLSRFDSAVVSGDNINSLKKQFEICRDTYKKSETIAEYYFQGLIKRVNGPALPDVKTEDGQVWPPHGFQVIEQILYENEPGPPTALSREIKLLQTDLHFMRKSMEYYTISASHVSEMIQHQFIRIAALGITGFDAPLSKRSIEEAVFSLQGIEEICVSFTGQSSGKLRNRLFNKSISYLNSNNEFDTFNRLEFLTEYLMPLSNLYSIPGIDTLDSTMVKPFRGTLTQYMGGEGFEADYYSGYAAAESNDEKIALGKSSFSIENYRHPEK